MVTRFYQVYELIMVKSPICGWKEMDLICDPDRFNNHNGEDIFCLHFYTKIFFKIKKNINFCGACIKNMQGPGGE